ncbi:hypothetical protein [Amycolatopsis australiensis]|uniref:hypothetical protein n=1 Tax=Amycolatopsis australiensis TaxID=546364 RepID=UPI000A55D202|nr:hypothetical protein [Amycolatopsis australiensis]
MEGVGDRATAKGFNEERVPALRNAGLTRTGTGSPMAGKGAPSGPSWRIRGTPGYAIFGRWTKHETLLNPDDVGAGHVVRFKRAAPDHVVRSRRPAHPEIVSVEAFTQARLMRRSRAAGGLPGIAKLERNRAATKHTYLLKRLVRCEICTRKMQGAAIRKSVYYRCIARTMAPGSAALADHPKTVNLREDVVVPPINEWLCQIFDPDNRDETVRLLTGSQDGRVDGRRAAADKRMKDAEAKLRRHLAAIEAGVDPVNFVEPMKRAQAERQAAMEELKHLPDTQGRPGGGVRDARPARRRREAPELAGPGEGRAGLPRPGPTGGLRQQKEAVTVTASPRVGNVCVRGGT